MRFEESPITGFGARDLFSSEAISKFTLET